jgi:hypothetical protein
MEDYDAGVDRLEPLCTAVVWFNFGNMPSIKEIIATFADNRQSFPIPGYRFVSYFGPPIILLGMLILALGGELFSGNVIGSTHLDNDLSYFMALRKIAFYGDSSFPLWNPYLMCGVPLIAEIQSGLFYPPNIVFRIFPIDVATNISLFIHLYLLAFSTYCYGRQIHISRAGATIAASVFCFCGPVFLRLFIGHHSDLYTIAWIPAVFFIVNRIGNRPGPRNFIYLGLVLCLQFLAGHPQYLFYTIFIAWSYLLFVTRHLLRRNLIRSWVLRNAGFFFSICIAVLIALPQIIPVLEMLSLSPRMSLDISDVAWFSFPPQNLLTFLTPLIFGDGVRIPYWGLHNLWEMCAYSGTMSLILSVVAIKNFKKQNHVVFFLFCAAFAVVVALGEHTPLFKLLYHIIPGFKMFRGHSKVLLFCCFAIALLAGIGYDTLRDLAVRRSRRFFLLLMGGVVIFFILLMMVPYAGLLEGPIKSFLSFVQNDPRSYLPVPGADNAEFVDAAIKQAVMSVRYFLISMFLGIFLVLFTLRFGSHRLLSTLTILFILTDLFIFGKSFVSSVDIHHWDLKPEAMEFLAQDQDQFRSAVITSFGPKYGITSLLNQITGDYPYVLRRYSRMYNLANGNKPTPSMKINNIRRVSPAHNLFNLKYLVLNSNRDLEIPGFYEVYDDGILSIFKNEYARNRVYLPRSIKIVDEEDEALGGVFEPSTIRDKQVILESESVSNLTYEYGSLRHPKDPSEAVEVVNYSANRIEIQTQLATDAWIILTDTFYPGWKATIDGHAEANIVPANYVFRAIYVPEGIHKIVFEFRPTYFTVALVVALITLLGACVVAVYPKKLR